MSQDVLRPVQDVLRHVSRRLKTCLRHVSRRTPLVVSRRLENVGLTFDLWRAFRQEVEFQNEAYGRKAQPFLPGQDGSSKSDVHAHNPGTIKDARSHPVHLGCLNKCAHCVYFTFERLETS